MIDEKAKISIGGMYREKACKPFYINHVTMSDEGNIKKGSKCILLMTDFDIQIFKSKAFGKVAQYKYFTHQDVKEIELTNDKILRIKYESEEHLISGPEMDDAFKKLFEAIFTILPTEELPQITPLLRMKKPDNAPIKRYKFLTYLRDEKPNHEISGYLQNYNFLGHSFNFDSLVALLNKGLIILLESINVTNIDTIEIPLFQNPKWKDVAKFLKNSSNITTLVSRDTVNEDIRKVISALKEEKMDGKRRINSIQLINSKTERLDVKYLLDLAHVPFLTSYKLENPFLDQSANHEFNKQFESNANKFEDIEILNFSKMSINYAPIFNFPNLTELALNSCEVEVADVFQLLSTKRNIKLRRLELQNNITKKSVPEDLLLPPNLESIDLSNNTWNASALVAIFLVITDHQTASQKLRLELANTKVEDNKWDEFKQNLDNFSTEKLTEFNWDNNPLFPDLVDYLSECRIAWLSINGCINQGEKVLENVYRYIAFTKRLRYLFCAGSESKILLDHVKYIIVALKTNRSLSHIDLSNQGFPPAILDSLSDALMHNRAVVTVKAVGNGITEGDALNKFYKSFARRGVNLSITFFDDKYKIKDPLLLDLMEIVRQGNPKIAIPSECRPKFLTVDQDEEEEEEEDEEEEEYYEEEEEDEGEEEGNENQAQQPSAQPQMPLPGVPQQSGSLPSSPQIYIDPRSKIRIPPVPAPDPNMIRQRLADAYQIKNLSLRLNNC
ncbi:hypothetical protein TVAG_044130 [Trichomonas vaginalis G3]|uniref:Leucine Rich Repeat family protein n=1 Tax=Trichomonas vaginalis (strain ATCC PRA-98 / G3) TaxID=412133 RepID=A2E0H3_TRIV3|nr:leucine-rich repeat, isoform f-related family [Trichomonas vaginalis G3]EAY13853.1 hypothetical protein TVAG_044130 [Trichomonas vaginalis G3]KAI5520445.1 leucine-rich repeat, isoform f-related family [Trichomonas vaginalis G3]|eukprot:XP_001326076.1 hypothetical protein [Trichomonas vaginalis G3]